MATVIDNWTNNLEDDTPLDGTELYGMFNALLAGVNGIDNDNIIANAGIEGTKIQDNSIAGVKLLANSIDITKMLDNSVGTDELVNLAVTQAKLELFTGPGTGVDTLQIEDGAITNAKLDIGQIGESAILWDDALGLRALHIGDAQIRMVRGIAPFSLVGSTGSTEDTGTEVFSVDAIDFIENFTSTPIVIATLNFDSPGDDNIRGIQLHGITTSQFEWRIGDDGVNTVDGDIMWIAIGSIA